MAKRPESLALKTFAYIKLGKYGLARGLARESHELSVRLLLDDLETATVSEAINTIGDSVQFRRQMVAAALAENTPEAIDDAFCLVLEGKDLTYSFLVDREGVKVASGTSRLTSLEQNLTENTCVIDFVEYTADTADIASENELPRFAVFVVRKKREKLDVNCIDLGAVSEINDLVDARWGTIKRALDDDAKSKALDRLLANARGVNDNTKEKAVVQDEFDSIVWSKIQPFLDGVDQLIVCPKNRLAEFPWSSIRTDDGDRFIAESGISIVVNESASVYANRTELETKAGGWLAIGGVDYGSLEKRDTSNADENVTHTAYKLEPRFGPLPQSLEEARAVVEHSPQKESSKVLAGLEANKHLFLKYSKDFQNIHIATHGVKLSSFKDSAPENFYKVKPLSEWALVLSSANELKDGKLQEKNVLTAEEISQLDLEHVDLVILSSCYSANGRTTTDGLFGIEKALRIAGVKTTLTCLTRLDDRTARLFVESFCEHISQGESKSAAFHSAQLEMIKQKVPYQNWCCWVLSGDCG